MKKWWIFPVRYVHVITRGLNITKSHEQPEFSYGFPMLNPIKPPFSHGLPMVYLCFSYGLPPMASPGASRAKMAFHMPKSSRLAKSRPRSGSCEVPRNGRKREPWRKTSGEDMVTYTFFFLFKTYIDVKNTYIQKLL